MSQADADLKRLMASWEFAYAMGSTCCGSEHPQSWAVRAEYERLLKLARTP